MNEFKVMRIWNALIACLIYFGLAVKTGVEPVYTLALFFVMSFGNSINDYFDIDIDKLRKPDRPLAKGTITKKRVAEVSAITFVSSIVCSGNLFWFFVLVDLALFLYSWKIKHISKPIGNLLIALLSALVVYLPAFQGAVGLKDIALAAFFASWAREIAKDVDEKDETSLYGVFGYRAIFLAFLLFVCAAVFAFSYVPLGVLLGVVLIVMLNLKNASKAEILMKLSMPVIVIAYMIFGD